MSPTPPSTGSSSVGGHTPEDQQFRVVRKRNRVPLSCGPCRHRKLKCNRSNPCDNCVRRGDAASCSYASPGTRKKNQSQGSSSPDDMQNRIDRLEGLVLSLMTNGAQSAGPTAAMAAISRSTSASGPSPGLGPDLDAEGSDMIKEEGEDSDVDEVSTTFGTLKVDAEKGKAMYWGDSHWHMVLSDIAEVKNYFINHKKELEQQYNKVAAKAPASAGPAFLFRAHETASEGELRAALPPRSAVEKLVARYFNSLDPSVYILHYPTFRAELRRHFEDPNSTCIVWLGLLFSVMTLAMQSYHKLGDEPPEWKGRTMTMANEYRLRTVQCLVTSDYTKALDNTIETLMLYVHGENSIQHDGEVAIWVIIGMIVRLAMRMGYHRDPKNFPGLSPFKAEMRRRVWSFIRQADIMFSFQLALPHMIRVGDCDVDEPRNLYDDEFGPESKELPRSRPLTEPTPFSYMLSKTRLAYVFGEIVEQINSIQGRTAHYEDIMRFDNKLRQAHAEIASHLKIRPLDECPHDPATLIVQRFHVDILYQKAMCVLHRKYLARARTNPRYAHSRRACVEAAMEILRHQETIHRESQPGGRIRTMRGILSALTKNDLLLGAMIVCLDLHYDSMPEQYDHYFWTSEQRADMFRALETTQKIWTELADSAIEAYKAANIITLMLDKVRRQACRPPGSSALEQQRAAAAAAAAEQSARTTQEMFAAFDNDNLQPEHSAAMTLGMLSTGGLTPNTAALFGAAGLVSPGGTKYNNVDMTMSDGAGTNGAGGAGGGTGLTPNYGMDLGGLNGVASPFSQVFGTMGSGTGMELPNNLDWEAWDSFLQGGNTIDPGLQFYGAPFMEPLGPPNGNSMAPDPVQQQQQQPDGLPGGGSNVGAPGAGPAPVDYKYGNSVFMGAGTPGRN